MNYSAAPAINFLSERKVKFDKNTRFAQKVKLWSGVVLVVYIALLVVLVMIDQVYAARQNQTEKALQAAKLELTSKLVVIDQYKAVVNRAKAIKQLLTERRSSIELWNKVKEILPEGTELLGFSLEESKLSLRFSAPNVVVANQVIDVVSSGLGGIEPSSAEVDVRRDESASYNVNVEATLSK